MQKNFINKIPIKYHLMVWYSTLFALVFAVAGWIILSLVQNTIEKNIANDLKISSEAIQVSIQSFADVSIRNHLRTVSTQNRDILYNLEKQVQAGALSLPEAKRTAEKILLSQPIGDSGYIYALTDKGVLAVHPHAELVNRDMSSHWIVQQQKIKKEGYIEYDWKNPGEVKSRAKALHMSYFPPWNWIISVSSYRDEFLSLFDIEDLKKGIEILRFSESSYAFIISGTGEVILQPDQQDSLPTHAHSLDADLVTRLLQQKSGNLFYDLVDPQTQQPRTTFVVFRYLPEFDWIIASSAYLDEVFRPLKRLEKIILLTIILAICLILPLSLYLGASITRPLTELAQMMNEPSVEDHSIQAEENAKGEVGVLARQFNSYMQRLRRSRMALQSEISERIHAEQQLKLFAKVFENALEGISITDADGTIVAVNNSFSTITGYSNDEAIGKNPRILKSNKHTPQFYKKMWDSLRQDGHWSGEIWNRRSNGEAYPEILSISSIADGKGEVTHYVAVFHDITEMKLKEEEIKYQAYHDALTGLPNRSLARDRLHMALANARRKKQHVAVLFMDLDNFKRVNDSLGHATGDLLLQAVGKRLHSLVREEDTVARLGGDEFQIISVDITSRQQIMDLAYRIIQGFQNPFIIEKHELFVTISIGAAIFPEDGRKAETLIRNADVAMYQAKQQGKNTVSLFTEDLSIRAVNRLHLEAEFRQALREKQFTVFYQPKVRPQDGAVVGVEALVRWQKPDGTMADPGEFIPLAEETGLINPLGDFVLNHACEKINLLNTTGCPKIKVAVNLSPYQFQQADLVERVMTILQKHDTQASQLELEITESTMMTDLEDSVAKLNLLVDEGISISIDDFGTGYSSLYYLKTFPIDTLKIDRSFVQDITVDPSDAQIVETIILMAGNLGIGVVAEGVETREQIQLLADYGCELVQGYYYSPPLAFVDLLGYLKKNSGYCSIS